MSKLTTVQVLTPALHAETYSPDSNRYDLLPFLRPPLLFQYKAIERSVEELEKKEAASASGPDK